MTLPPERDANGRFVKPDTDTEVLGDHGMHPISKLLFGWVGSPRTPFVLLVLVIAICVALVLIDLAVNRHEYLDFANANGFYALWGFAAFALAVLSGWPLSKLLRRDEDYYGEADTTPQDVEVEP
jgi:fucose 4-O-acetylase-like acetyltransferase